MTTQKNRTATTNTGFTSGGETCKLGALCFYSNVVLVDIFPALAGQVMLRNQPERKARKRYGQV
jgi:hypothetical protein